MIFRIVKYVIYDILRSRIAVAYTIFLLLASVGLFNIGGDSGRGLVSLLSIVLMLVPLMSVVFSTVHFYNSYEFIELLSSQPLRRDTILLAEYLGVAGALSVAFIIGVAAPVAIYDGTQSGLYLVAAGLMLTLIFAAIAFLSAVCTRDKARGIGVAMLIWLFFTLIYDAFVLFVLVTFQDYPLEKPAIAMVALNPVDLARVMVLLQMDISALMGVTGAVMKEFFGNIAGIIAVVAALAFWMFVPLCLAVRIFRRRDL